jgi:tRNA dimethylallyltransferase
MVSSRPRTANAPVVVITGPTASGKTGLAIALAKKYNGEIICADSRTVYKEMDIGTAKPTIKEQKTVPHWGLDLVEPGERFTAYDFKMYADKKIGEIRARGHIPFLVGGTGLYIDAVVLDYEFAGSFEGIFRNSLENKTLEELYLYCSNNNIELPENDKNKRHVINTILRKGISIKSSHELRDDVIVVGITTEKETLLARMKVRTEQLLNDGVVDEAITLGKKYGWDAEVLKSNVYRAIRESLTQKLSDEEIVARTVTLDWQLAKRQMTWFRRNTFINWLNLNDARIYLEERLAKK